MKQRSSDTLDPASGSDSCSFVFIRGSLSRADLHQASQRSSDEPYAPTHPIRVHYSARPCASPLRGWREDSLPANLSRFSFDAHPRAMPVRLVAPAPPRYCARDERDSRFPAFPALDRHRRRRRSRAHRSRHRRPRRQHPRRPADGARQYRLAAGGGPSLSRARDHAGDGQCPYPCGDVAAARPGRRPAADGVAAGTHLAGGGQVGRRTVRARRHRTGPGSSCTTAPSWRWRR